MDRHDSRAVLVSLYARAANSTELAAMLQLLLAGVGFRQARDTAARALRHRRALTRGTSRARACRPWCSRCVRDPRVFVGPKLSLSGIGATKNTARMMGTPKMGPLRGGPWGLRVGGVGGGNRAADLVLARLHFPKLWL